MESATLKTLPSITRLSPHAVRILGQNPGKFTLQGTNTYLLGKRAPYLLFDVGEGKEEYIPQLQDALLSDAGGDAPLISDIIVSHRHGDHHGGLPSVLSLLHDLYTKNTGSTTKSPYKPPRIHKFPSEPDPTFQRTLAAIASLPFDTHDNEAAQPVILDLSEGQILSSEDSSVSLHIIHTPGHTTDSLSAYIPENNTFLTADTILGQGTAVFEDLGAYISSLQKLLAWSTPGQDDPPKLYPGHGPVIDNGKETIKSYIAHRVEREEQILARLRPNPEHQSGNPTSIRSLIASIYAQYPQNLWPAAAMGIRLHLLKLQGDGRVSQRVVGNGPEGWVDDEWSLVNI